jgi:hypothetical protein
LGARALFIRRKLMKIVIPGALAYSVEGQSFKPDGKGVYDIPDALIPKMNEQWQAPQEPPAAEGEERGPDHPLAAAKAAEAHQAAHATKK